MRLNELHAKQMDYFNSHHRGIREFAIGDRVLLIRPKEVGGNKTSSWWTGPYEVAQRLGKGVYELRISENELREAHSDQLKPYHLECDDS